MSEDSKTPPDKAVLGHRKRLREKFLKSGLAGFHDYEIVELLLSLGTPRKDCKQQAKEAITGCLKTSFCRRVINDHGFASSTF